MMNAPMFIPTHKTIESTLQYKVQSPTDDRDDSNTCKVRIEWFGES